MDIGKNIIDMITITRGGKGLNLLHYIRLIIALAVARVYIRLASVAGLRASTLPGAMALKIYPGIISHLCKQLKYISLVTGTNGKTTTNNMISSILESAGYRVVANREGANLATGIATALIKASGLTGSAKGDIVCLEVDEAAFPALAKILKPNAVVITNFFKDQLDRYGDVSTTVMHIRKTLGELDTMPLLILNADDPLVASVGDISKKPVYFSLNLGNTATGNEGHSVEGRLCPQCGSELVYANYNYSQLGDYKCPSCGFKRPTAKISARVYDDGNDGIFMDIYGNGENLNITLPPGGTYNAYNALAAISLGKVLRVDDLVIKRAVGEHGQILGRMEMFSLGNKTIYLNLVKNPTGFNESLKTFTNATERKALLIALNDNVADGRDISWIWDVNFEMLKMSRGKADFVCFTGSRAEEMALRFKYADLHFESTALQKNLSEAVKVSISGGQTTVYLFTSYTALWSVRNTLTKLGAKEQRHAASSTPISGTSKSLQ